MPWLVDDFIDVGCLASTQFENDNRRIYIPIDLNQKMILRRLGEIIRWYESANEHNELDFFDVRRLFYQAGIYGRILFLRHMSENKKHSHS